MRFILHRLKHSALCVPHSASVEDPGQWSDSILCSTHGSVRPVLSNLVDNNLLYLGDMHTLGPGLWK